MAATIKQRIALDGGKELKRELEEFGAAGRKAFKELQDAAAQTKGLSPGFFNSLKQAEVQLKSLAQSFNEAGKAIQNVGRTLTTSLTLPIVGVGAGILKVSGDFQKAMNSFAVNAGVAGTALEDARAKAKELGVASVFSTTEAAEGMTELAKVGLDFQTIMGGAAKAMVDLAAANDTGLAASASVVGDVINQFKLSASQLPAIVDQITGATIESKLSFDDYTLAIGQAGGAAGALGVQFEEFNAVIAATASSFASGSDAGTSFKTFLTRLVPQSNQAAAMMEKLGLKFFDASGKMKSMSQIAQELQIKLGKLSQEDLNDAVSTIFGTDALRTAIALMRQGGNGIDDMMAKLKNTDSAEIAATRVKGFNGELGKLIEALNNLGIAIGDSGFLDFATNIVIKLTEWTEQLAKVSPEMLKLGTIIGGVVASIGPLLFGLGLMTRGFGIALEGASLLIGAVRGLAAALLFLRANPIVAILSGLAAVSGALGLWADSADQVTVAMGAHRKIVDEVKAAYDKAQGSAENWADTIKHATLLQVTANLQDVIAAAGEARKALQDLSVGTGVAHLTGDDLKQAEALRDLSKEFITTGGDVDEFKKKIQSIADSTNAEPIKEYALALLNTADTLRDTEAAVGQAKDVFTVFTGSAQEAQAAIERLSGKTKDSFASGLKDAGVAIDETAKKVENLGHQITVTRGGGTGELTKEVFDVVDGVAKRVEESKKALDDVSASAETAGSKVKAVADDIASHIRTVPDSLKTNSITPAVDGIITDVQRVKPAADEAATGLKAAFTPTDDLGGGLNSAITTAVDGVISDVQRLPGAAAEAVGGLNSALAGIDTSGAQQAATAVAQPFQQLPSIFSQIFSGLGSLIQGGFGNLTSVIRSLAGQIRSEINSIIAALRQAVAQAQALRAQASSGGSGSSSGGSQGGFASGGHVRGPGGPRTDSILAWLSDGEFVIQAAAVKKLGVGFLSALNNGFLPSLKGLRGFSMGGLAGGFNRSMSQLTIPRFAAGGMVPALAAPTSGGGRRPFILQLPSGEQIDDLTIGNIALARLQKLAINSSLLSTGRKPLRR
ncbi:MAG: phage tail tape measure protein [Mesorhizobium sp.]|uniref:phage tail tape measure protein n=1 Tax=Mesorhizobium sp. TaxID=1871066 RepID=UPI000FE8443F|nr:phage tail tape measure protein [Mesorhizobium sp.]RWO29569.1 MAG: phage tail tape measure protein [Mesorhizobium sp.]